MKNKKTKKERGKLAQVLAFVLYMLAGAGCGIFIGKYISELSDSGKTIGELLFEAALLLAGLYLASFFQIVVHEAGHLVFGLLTGYRFCSFRIGSLMWIKDENGIRFCRYSLAGTGGQCLMEPPAWNEEKTPCVLYNLGGPVMNLIFVVLFGGAAFYLRENSGIFIFFLEIALMGAAFALINGLPLHLGTVDNDGYNAFSLGKNKKALYSFWLQMKVNEEITRGSRLKDMPAEWFEMPAQKELENSMVAVIGVFACNRAMDEMDFHKASSMIRQLTEQKSGMVGLHRNLLLLDLIYCQLTAGETAGVDSDISKQLEEKSMQKFIKIMKKYPSVLRTQYAYALLGEDNEEKAQQIKENFEKTVQKYPYPAEVQGERELMEYAWKRHQE
ncbi:MAG: M50 family metallopeptidase [Lachnospiraceae bacterium]|nr:M50 family metallopeptidase [Lachnospiraceae bacterium]